MWFVGTGQPDGATQIRLYLMNTGNVAASVDVTILTDTGQQNGLSRRHHGRARTSSWRRTSRPFVHGSQALALHVQTSSGQVAASVWEGAGPGGGAWLPQAAAPCDDPGDPRPDRGEQRRASCSWWCPARPTRS